MTTSSTGLSDNVAHFLSYLFGWLTGLVMLLVEKNSESVRFHAAQSIVLFGGLTALNFLLPMIPFLGWLVALLLAPVSTGLWIIMLIMALMGNAPRLPVIADFAEQLLEKFPLNNNDRIEKQ